MIRLLIKSGTDRGLSFELKPGVNRLGRNPDNDLVLKDSSVCGEHCEFLVQGTVVSVHDHNSPSGTSIGGKRIAQAELQKGEILKVGDVELQLDISAINIAIPEVKFAEKTRSAVLSDGSTACLNHATVKAPFRCTQCQRYFCPNCVKKLRLSGGELNIFCPSCSGVCELLEWARPKEEKKKSFFARLLERFKGTPKP